MAASLLLNQVSDEFGGDVLNRIASAIGESPGKIKTALGDMLPALLGGLASKAQTPEGAHELLDVIHRDHLDSAQYEHVAEAVNQPNALGNLMNTGGRLVDTVLPGKSGAVSDWVASHADINPSSSKSLMGIVLPLVLGLIGRRVGNGGESGLMNLLGKPSAFLQNAPAGLTGVLGNLGGMAGAAAGATRPALTDLEQQGRRYAGAAASTESPARRWLWPVLLLIALFALLSYFMGKRGPAPGTSSTSTAPTATAPVVSGAALGVFIDKQLPNGVTLHIPANGIESKLLAFLDDPSKTASPDTWFSFDRLEFETNSSTLKPSSQEQVRNIAEIMKAYPQMTAKFGGYTDNTGNAAQNVKLSGERAMNQAAALGVDASRMTAEGYGEQHPVADNSTEEGRQRNRRVALNVTAK